jgi:rhamnogalacturonyl hydrolase YesR
MKKYNFKIILLSIIFVFSTVHVQSQKNTGSSNLKKFPKGSTPEEIGTRVTENFISRPFDDRGNGRRLQFVIYPIVCTWYGGLTFAKESGNTKLTSQLIERFQPLFGEASNLIPEPVHVDNNVFGAVPFEIYMQTKEEKYLKLGKTIADKQWEKPEGRWATPEALNFFEQGYTWQTRLWIDDMYMITAVQSQAYRATGDLKYIERAAKEMVMYLDSLQRPNGLFYHAPDVPFFWGRGDGWMAAGMAELLRSLPADNPNRERIMTGYKTMMASLLKYQDKSGMWRQLIDDDESWLETSSTGMFTFSMITGVKNGWLDKKIYGAAARKGWLALITYINQDSDVKDICAGTNKKNDRQYYLDRPKMVGDLHGQAPILWCATALLR